MTPAPPHFMKTSGANDSVWVHQEPYEKVPQFPQLDEDLETDVCVIGSGMAGISTAYELVKQGTEVVMIEARDMVSGETGRTSGHLSSDLDQGYIAIASKFGQEEARLAAESHKYALLRVGQISQELGIECEYRQLPAYNISMYPRGEKGYDDDMKEFKEEADMANKVGLDSAYLEDYAIKGWNGSVDQRGSQVVRQQATFHPTKYTNGVLGWLKKQPNFKAYSRTRAVNISESGITVPVIKVHLGSRSGVVETVSGNKISASHIVQATNVPLQKLSMIVEIEYNRTYCIAIRVPKGSVEDCLIYDSDDPYKYSRLTACDEKDDYIVIGGCDHKVGQEAEYEKRYKELEDWVRERFTQATSVDYKWSGQIMEPVDYMAYIGPNPGQTQVYVVTGTGGNGLTHGVIAGKLLSDMILGHQNDWAKVYDPGQRTKTIAKTLPKMIQHDVQINLQFKRFLQSDLDDIEDLGKGKGGVLNSLTKKPIAVYKDDNGKVHRFSAICPHLKGVVCWNDDEKSWDCPIHGSRFSASGVQLCGPALAGLNPEDESAEKLQKIEISAQ